MIDYQTALALAKEANKQLDIDAIHDNMMKSVYDEIENAAKLGQFKYECRYIIGNRGIEELKNKGFRVSYDNYNEIYKIKWYPRDV